MNTSLHRLADYIDTLALRERVLLLAATIALLFFTVDTLALQAVLKSQQLAADRISELDSRLDVLRRHADLSHARRDIDPVQKRREQRDRLKQELSVMDQRIANQLGVLTESSRATEVLEQVLTGHSNLKLISLNAGTRAFDGQEIEPDNRTALRRYQIELILDGDYKDVLAYLEQLEALPWKFFWQKIDFQRSGRAQARTHLQLYTLSVDHG